jgi:hypothetical protein
MGYGKTSFRKMDITKPKGKSKDSLTVIIPFLNEREEVYNTLENVRETGGDKFI